MPQFRHVGKLTRYDCDNGKLSDSALIFVLRTLTQSVPPLPGDFVQEKEIFCLQSAESSLEAKPQSKIRKVTQQMSLLGSGGASATQPWVRGTRTGLQLTVPRWGLQ